ncbi:MULTISPECIES: type II secretion system protein GspM [Rhodanobacter]|uniref:type II secretion system protein GspM n=1 Tax=Rhodanobacter TaxID=75309 RepID=UPI000260D0D5|nr:MULTISPECIES: type II secretion system protein GspM [Rhodanobacter]EIM00752.1 putative general secretion pathway protein M [Rhodanobacter denitrificans]KZC20799.1 general secretion pathway protein GspM [Rhodanobacter denitrificans]UJJ50858.1 type II secretion system protein GspM [Rhodanobacter denitrificans]UJM90813.1 type II secretion system protein GspM [Rhodanobacter denitrificans]UJM93573.1 type II secretion system protein GspM [Rhodanobacter denitrificans]
MKTIAMNPRDSRIAAIILLLLALALAYVVLLRWWFVVPLRQVRAEMADLRDTHSRYAAAIAEKPALQQRLAALGAGQAASSAFLAADDPNTAAGDLMQRVIDVVAANAGGGQCTVTQKMPLPSPAPSAGEPYRKAAVSISLNCDMAPLAAVLQALEQGTPYLFVDDLSIYRNPVVAQQNNAAALEVQFSLSGYVRPARTAPASSDRAPDDAGGVP